MSAREQFRRHVGAAVRSNHRALRSFRRKLDSRKNLVGAFLADFDFRDFKTGAALGFIQHFRQDERIDNVTAQLNVSENIGEL